MSKDIDALYSICSRCSYKWFKRKVEDPKQCPRCHSPYWKTKRVRAKDREKWNINKGDE